MESETRRESKWKSASKKHFTDGTEALVDDTVSGTYQKKPDFNLIRNTPLDETLETCRKVSIIVLLRTFVGL